jgi:hypothetical protein
MNKAPLTHLTLHTTEEEQRRLTVISRFVSSAGVLSDEVIVFLARNENHERIPELLLMAASLGQDQRLTIQQSVKASSSGIVIPGDLARTWELFWKTEYGIKADFAGLIIPAPPVGYNAALLVMHEKASQAPEMLFQSDKKAYGGKVWKFTDSSLDEVVPTHKLTGTFGAWVADQQEAPDGCVGGINLNTNAVDELGWVTETLPMRQVHGRRFFREHNEPLDTKVFTLCPGSCAVDGSVPSVDLDGDGYVSVSSWIRDDALGLIRFRRAVSL